MSNYDPRYEPVERDGYGIWALLGVIALIVVVGFIYWGASESGSEQTASAPITRSETTGMGSPSVPTRPSAAPATTPSAPAPAPSAPANPQ